ncbi:hypothetical protein [Lapidilactobacillus bayanensis]|uniref:hypothetical protein n=1 Tax=Lapidilactobacillus bayanensis TaxID=2485998 RepID=UPI000F78A934|nr:hypothetical protein [Lapidilactobacillus bayanensis]
MPQIREFSKETEISQIIHRLQNKLKTTFSESTALHIGLWLKVSRTRVKLNYNVKNEEYGLLIQEAFQDPLYRQVLDVYANALIQGSSNKNLRNSLYLYLLIISLYIEDSHNNLILNQYADWQNPFNTVNQQSEWMFNYTFEQECITDTMIQNKLRQTWQPISLQLFNQHYLFRGKVVFSFIDYQTHKEDSQTTVFDPIVEQLIDHSLQVIDKTPVKDYSRITYSSFFNSFVTYVQNYAGHKVLIGFYVKHGYSYTYALINQFNQQMALPMNYQVEAATPDQDYDLLITDSIYFLDKFGFKKSYILNDTLSETDLTNLRQILRENNFNSFHKNNLKTNHK